MLTGCCKCYTTYTKGDNNFFSNDTKEILSLNKLENQDRYEIYMTARIKQLSNIQVIH
jgi:hypothetical protein